MDTCRGPKEVPLEPWSPAIFSLEPGSRKPFSTLSPDKNADSGYIEPLSEAVEPESPNFSVMEPQSPTFF